MIIAVDFDGTLAFTEYPKIHSPIMRVINYCKNRKCIVNTDLDGILSGILLKNFLNWEIVG